MRALDFRKSIVVDNLKKANSNIGRLTSWEKTFVSDLASKIRKGYLKPEKLSNAQFNTLQEITEGLRS